MDMIRLMCLELNTLNKNTQLTIRQVCVRLYRNVKKNLNKLSIDIIHNTYANLFASLFLLQIDTFKFLHKKLCFNTLLVSKESNVITRYLKRKTLLINWSKKQVQILLILYALGSINQDISQQFYLSIQYWQEISCALPGRSRQDCFFKFLSLQTKKVKYYPWTQQQSNLLSQIVKSPYQVDWVQASKQVYRKSKDQVKVFRSGKQCRQHYFSYLFPNLNKSSWTAQQDQQLMTLAKQYGNKWFEISKIMVGRNQNSIKNRYIHFKKKYVFKQLQIDQQMKQQPPYQQKQQDEKCLSLMNLLQSDLGLNRYPVQIDYLKCGFEFQDNFDSNDI